MATNTVAVRPAAGNQTDEEVIRLARRELANRYGSRGTTDQLRCALMVLEETSQRGAA